MSNTLCENCFFAKTIESDKSCVFGIPDLIKDTYSVEEYNNHYKLINYNCRYGLSKKIYQENIDKFTSVDLIEYIKQQNIVQYSLSIVMTDDNAENTFNLLNSLSIKPHYITAICYHHGGLLHKLLSKQEPYIPYKVHNFLEDMPAAQALHVALETNKNKIGNLMWILNDQSLRLCVENNSIQNINYLINVTQQPAHYYQSKNIDSSFDGIFINTNNYWALSRTKDYTIEQSDQTLVIQYD
jgi:hypothetical protein